MLICRTGKMLYGASTHHTFICRLLAEVQGVENHAFYSINTLLSFFREKQTLSTFMHQLNAVKNHGIQYAVNGLFKWSKTGAEIWSIGHENIQCSDSQCGVRGQFDFQGGN